jgi:DNA sulfur modification protein DndE
MNINRIRISKEATSKLQTLKNRTGLTPNILCRIALCYSLNEKQTPQPQGTDVAGQEFNHYTLFGENEVLYLSLLKERCLNDGLDPEKDLLDQLHAHLERGIVGVFSRVKQIADLHHLVPTSGS